MFGKCPKRYYDRNRSVFDIANKIDKILSDRKISQKDFAAMIGKKNLRYQNG